ncbi:TVP38/TMEM64 family protein [Streptomyces sp. NRRL WC-3742]|uniref:TVP38/TMEM64 family protein n=1 Tax=Streptomyces sp. NRRL WC-3742 TaxID=1463934 RepID=UPI00069214F7|nr:VTT domain-containing protein [Streptomyces sp. NRRL WC-3742]
MPATEAPAAETAPAPSADPLAEAPRSRAAAWWRLGVLVVLLGAAAGSLLLWSPAEVLDGGLADRLPVYWFAPLFALVYAVGTLAFVPRPALNAAAGLLLGIQEGVALAVAGTTVGAAMAFGLGRWLGREALRPYLRGKVLGALDRRFTEQGFRSVLVLRLLPGMPFQAGNYGAAFSGVRFLPFVLATLIGVVPTTAVYVAAAASASRPGSTAFLVSAGGVAVLVLGTLVGLWRAAVARRRSRHAAAA